MRANRIVGREFSVVTRANEIVGRANRIVGREFTMFRDRIDDAWHDIDSVRGDIG